MIEVHYDERDFRIAAIDVTLGDKAFRFPRGAWGPGAHHSTGRPAGEAMEALKYGRYQLGFSTRHGTFVHADEKQTRRLRALVLGTARAVPGLADLTSLTIREYVPGLWNHGTYPAFIAPKGFAKTWLVCQLAAALILGSRWLAYFDPVDMTDQERARNVVLLNPETEPGAIHDVLIRCGLVQLDPRLPIYRRPGAEDGEGSLIVEHLLAYDGGATAFDLSDPAKADGVAELLIARSAAPPLTVLADGITAMIGNVTSRTGAFTSEFMRVLTMADIPNGLGVLHSPMNPTVDTAMDGLQSIGQWHGMWLGSANGFPVEATTPRSFRVGSPRLGGAIVPRRRLFLGPDQLWRLQAMDGGESPRDRSSSDHDKQTAIIAKLRQAHPDKMWTKDLLPTDDYKAWKSALRELEERGEVISAFRQNGRARGYLFGLPSDSD